jgi:hypothetical protein
MWGDANFQIILLKNLWLKTFAIRIAAHKKLLGFQYPRNKIMPFSADLGKKQFDLLSSVGQPPPICFSAANWSPIRPRVTEAGREREQAKPLIKTAFCATALSRAPSNW